MTDDEVKYCHYIIKDVESGKYHRGGTKWFDGTTVNRAKPYISKGTANGVVNLLKKSYLVPKVTSMNLEVVKVECVVKRGENK